MFSLLQVSAHTSKKTIAEFSSAPEDFMNKYDECRSRNYKVLDPLISLLSSVVGDDGLRQGLEKNAKERAIAGGYNLQPAVNQQTAASLLPASGTNLTQDELNKLKERLLSASGTTSAYASADVLRRVLKERTPRKVNATIPESPPWLTQRPHLSLNFHSDAFLAWNQDEVEPIERMIIHEQEVAVIEDLLSLMEGIEGVYITSKRKSPEPLSTQTFSIANNINTSLKDLTRRLLPVCSNFATIIRFIEEKSVFDYGTVNHALSAAMWNLMRDYLTLTAQLETQLNTGQLTLQKMWFYLQPTMRTFELLAHICKAIDKGECKGGAVLSILHEKTTSMIGDAKGEELSLYLTQAACVPYFEMLQKWIYKGVINDPYGEFLVEENEEMEKNKLSEDYSDNYWKKHYTYCHDQCPKFLEGVAEKTLRTGKYLNVIRNCGRDVICPFATELNYSLHSRQLTEHIEKAYDYASKLLLDLLMTEKALLARLKSLKHYFLLDRGDFIVQFMDMAEDEMRKHIDEIVPSRLENLMELALRTSTAKLDPFNEDLRVHLFPYDLITQLFKVLSITESTKERDIDIDPIDMNLSGLEAFSFDYTVQWPLSLVISKMVLTRYQMLFRHLFYSKYVERQLSAIWTSCKGSKVLGLSAGSSPW
jgi:gamma-tubulin complex component 2